MDSSHSSISIILEDINDGHSPGGTSVPSKLARYHNKQSSNFFAIYDNVLPEDWCNRSYQYAINKSKPWGTYITMSDAIDSKNISAEDLWDTGNCERAIALIAVRSLLLQKASSFIQGDLGSLHGTAVWCLVSGDNDEVQYHIDYGELHRYETNTIYPPVYAGTCHLSPVYDDNDMRGGAFKANTNGVDHYKRFGYKCRLSSSEEFEKDLRSSSWITVPYKYNRGMLHDGDFPHFSSKIEYIRSGIKRVILGFNVFTSELSECNLRAPEHSEAFNRTIKLYQRMAALGIPITSNASTSNSNPVDSSDDNFVSKYSDVSLSQSTEQNANAPRKGISVKDVMKNPALAKMIIKAAKNMKELGK